MEGYSAVELMIVASVFRKLIKEIVLRSLLFKAIATVCINAMLALA